MFLRTTVNGRMLGYCHFQAGIAVILLGLLPEMFLMPLDVKEDISLQDQRPGCRSCDSCNLIELKAETCIHFPGLKGLKVEPIFIFPKTTVCLDCGFMWSILAETQIEQIRRAADLSCGTSA